MQEYERYITVNEAADRLNRPESEIDRMLETGALPAVLRAELTSKEGKPIGFDFALLPPEGVARVVDQGGDDFTLVWQYCGGHGKAVCFPARQSSIRVLWEPSLFPELMPQLKDGAQPSVAGQTEALSHAASNLQQSGEVLAPAAPNYAMLATPYKLIVAFGSMSGMNSGWFRSMKDRPALKAAVTVPGVRGRRGAPPMLDVFKVLQYLIDPKRKGKPMRAETGWRLMADHFPQVHAKYEAYAPDTTD